MVPAIIYHCNAVPVVGFFFSREKPHDCSAELYDRIKYLGDSSCGQCGVIWICTFCQQGNFDLLIFQMGFICGNVNIYFISCQTMSMFKWGNDIDKNTDAPLLADWNIQTGHLARHLAPVKVIVMGYFRGKTP